MSSSPSLGTTATPFYQSGIFRRFDRWLHAMPHPPLVVEMAGDHVAAARWGNVRGHLEQVAAESLPAGSVMPSTVDTNITQPEAVRSALRRVFTRVPGRGARWTEGASGREQHVRQEGTHGGELLGHQRCDERALR